MIVTTYNQHVRLLSSEPFGWFAPPKSTRAWEPTLLWNHYTHGPLTICEVDSSNRKRILCAPITDGGNHGHFVTLVRYTQQGISKIKESPARLDAARRAAEKAGGKIHAWYLTMGRYDAVFISEFPNDEAGAKFMLSVGRSAI